MKLKNGDTAPNLVLPNAEGKMIDLRELVGKKIVLFFYPKDNTPGCTREACDFRDSLARITDAGAIVMGISADSPASHLKFKMKYELPYDLLSDEKKEVLGAYDVWKNKKLYGRSFLGIERTTVVIDEHGKIAKIFNRVKVPGHIDEVIEFLQAMGTR